MSIVYKLEPHDIHELATRPRRRLPREHVHRDVEGIIKDFDDSDYNCCRVCVCENSRVAQIEATILRRSVKSSGCDNVRVVLRGNEVYLVKKSKWAKLV